MGSDQLLGDRRRSVFTVPIGSAGALWLGIAAVGLAAFFWKGAAWLLSSWERPEYSHGYLIPPIALYLFLSQLRSDPHAGEAPTGWRLGIATTLLGMVVGLLGNVIDAPGISVYGLVTTIAGLVLSTLGTRRGLRYWPPVLYLGFMLPLPTSIYWQLSIKLQTISSEIGVGLIRLAAIPVLLSGNVIDLGTYQLQVAEACSGLRYLFPLASFGFLFAVLYRGPFWQRLVLFLSTLPIAVVMNSIRIGVIGILVNHFGIAQAEGFLHAFEGWIIFIACVAILYAEAFVLQLFLRGRQPIQRMLEIDFSAMGRTIGRLSGVKGTHSLIAASLIVAVIALAWNTVPARSFEPPIREPLVLFPMSLGQWEGKQAVLDPDIEAVLAADDYVEAHFNSTTGDLPVNLFVAYYKFQTQGAGIHSPEVCIPAGGWEVSRWEPTATGITTPSGVALSVNRAIIQKGTSRQLVYYWFEERGRALTNDYAAKAYTVLDAITRGRADGALVRVITPISDAVPLSVADERLRAFLGLALPELRKHVPG